MDMSMADKQALISRLQKARQLHIATLNECAIAKELILKSKHRPTKAMVDRWRVAEENYRKPQKKFFKVMDEVVKVFRAGVFTAGNFGEVMVVTGEYAWFTHIERVL